jgi:hypothetical protein
VTSEPVDVGGFRLWVSEIDGIRTIETRYPARIDVTKLSTVIAAYYDLWDDESPTINLSHIEQLEALNAQVRAVLKSVVLRTIGQDSFVGSAWVCGTNADVGREVVTILREAGRGGASVFAARDEAIDYLQNCIVDWRSLKGTPEQE